MLLCCILVVHLDDCTDCVSMSHTVAMSHIRKDDNMCRDMSGYYTSVKAVKPSTIVGLRKMTGDSGVTARDRFARQRLSIRNNILRIYVCIVQLRTLCTLRRAFQTSDWIDRFMYSVMYAVCYRYTVNMTKTFIAWDEWGRGDWTPVHSSSKQTTVIHIL